MSVRAPCSSTVRRQSLVIFQSEADLLDVIATHDRLVDQCVTGHLTFLSFLEKYNGFYFYFALDGHESDEEERELLLKHDRLIEPHRVIAEEILVLVCSDSDAALESYKQVGRIDSVEALERLRKFALSPNKSLERTRER
jgi:hypothetical protein